MEFVNGSCAGVFSGDIGTIGKGVVVGSTCGRNDGSETLLSGKLHDVMATAKSRSIQVLQYQIRVGLEFEIMGSVKLNSSQPTEFVLGFEDIQSARLAAVLQAMGSDIHSGGGIPARETIANKSTSNLDV